MTSEVTQEARNAAADLLHEVGCLLGDDGIGQVADLIRDGEYDDHDATIAFAKFERETIARMNAKPSDDKAIMRELRPSKAAMEKIERMEQANAAGLAEIRNMPFGSAAQSGEGEREIEKLRAENARLREQIAANANSINAVGSAYDDAIKALDRLVAETKASARAALRATDDAGGA